MWWRRCVSPVVGSTATAGVLRWSCERCMPRREGDFLFCWTAMFKLLCSQCLRCIMPRRPANGELSTSRSVGLASQPSWRGAYGSARISSSSTRSRTSISLPATTRSGLSTPVGSASISACDDASTSSAPARTSCASGPRHRWQRSCRVPRTLSCRLGRPRSSRTPVSAYATLPASETSTFWRRGKLLSGSVPSCVAPAVANSKTSITGWCDIRARMISSLEFLRQNKAISKMRAQPRRLVLASTSSYRKALLERLGLAFDVAAPHADERPLAGEDASATALRLAGLKAQSVRAAHRDALIIGSDQVATSAGRVLGKPGDHATAARQLRSLSGKSADFHTAIALLNSRNNETQSRVVLCRVVFRALDERRIQAYLRREQPYDCAGSAKAEGLGIALIARVETEDPTSLIGLPLIALTEMLERAGLPVLG